MSIFSEISRQHALADAPFEQAEQRALDENDEQAFDEASKQRRHNDQAYFLYLFTRFENEVNGAVQQLLAALVHSSQPWADRRVWEAWSRGNIKGIPFLSKFEVLTDKSKPEFRQVKEFYESRNRIAHGEELEKPFIVESIAEQMDKIVTNFVVT